MSILLDQPTLAPIDIGEKGFTGTRIYNGLVDVAQYEWLPQFQGVWNLVDNIDIMRNDAYLASIEKGIIQPIVQGEHRFSYDHPDALNDPQLKYNLDFINDQFLNINMTQARRNAALSVIYGFYILENVVEEHNGKWFTTKLGPRQPRTAYKWYPDKHGELETLEQLVFAYNQDGKSGQWLHIPIDKDFLLVFTHNKEGNYFLGRSEFRPLYREWLVKNTVMKTLITAIQRVGAGVPTAILNDENVPVTSKDGSGNTVKGAMDATIEALEKLQNSESSALVMRYIKDFKFQTIAPQAVDSLLSGVVKYCDEAMGKSMYQMIVNMGTTTTGSRALGTVFEDKYIDFEMSIASELDEVFDQQHIKRMIQWNFGAQKLYPKSHITIKRDMDAIFESLGSAKQKGLIQGNKDIENVMLRYYNLPETTKENVLPAATKGSAPLIAPMSENGHSHAKEAMFSEGKYVSLNREPTDREKTLCNFAEVTGGLNTIIGGLSHELRQIIEPAMLKAAKQISNGEKVYNIKFPWGNKLTDLYFKYYQQLKKAADQHVKKEIGKQKGANLSEIMFADKKPKPAPDDFDSYSRQQSDLNSDLMDMAAKTAIINYTKAGIDAGLSGSELADFIMKSIMDESGQRYESGASKITGGYAYAREVTAEEFSEVIDKKVRSEIMDKGTCEVCAGDDGAEYELDDDSTKLPDPNCEGAPKCRGIWLYSIKGE